MRFWRPGANRWDRALAITLVAGLAMLLLIGLVFAIAYGSQRITSDSTALHKADEVLRSSTVIRAQLSLAGQAGVIDRRYGASSKEAIAVSLDETRVAIEDIDSGLSALVEDDVDITTLEAETDHFVTTANQIFDLLERGRYEEAQAIITSDLSVAFDDLVDHLVQLRDELATSVASSDVLLGHIGNAARFLVAFLLPAAVIFIYRDLLRRQAKQTELESRLETERQISTAREEFIANASHELRTPLTSITGLALLLEEDPTIKSDDASAELLDLIVSESGDLNRMVEDLLTTARLDAGALSYTFQNVEPKTEIEELVESMRRAGNAIQLDLEPAPVRADPIRLRQIVRNLLSNAAKYGGPDVRVVGRVEARTYVVEVIDNGGGVPPAVGARLFERFVHQGNTTAERGSVGLGLSIVHALAQGMGGSVSYRRDNGDSHFAVRLSLSEAPIEEFEPSAGVVGGGLDGLAG